MRRFWLKITMGLFGIGGVATSIILFVRPQEVRSKQASETTMIQIVDESKDSLMVADQTSVATREYTKEKTMEQEVLKEKVIQEKLMKKKVMEKNAMEEKVDNESYEYEETNVYKETYEDVNKEMNDEERTLSIVAVGDDLIHTQVIKSGLQADGSYNFDHLFSGVLEEIQSADLAIINQETILCDISLGYTGYPLFGSPYEVGIAVHDAGFDVVLQATNHTLDKGIAGVEDTIQFWKQYDDILVTGINESDEEKNRIGYIKRNGITVAILNYTYGLNGLRLPSGKEYMVNLLTDEEQLKRDIATANENSDFVIVCPHWGTEYVYEPTVLQKELVQLFANEGVDLVIGTHPHVLEPVEWVTSEDGGHTMLVYYSLGNFVSNQDAMARMLGGMAFIQLKEVDGEVVIDEASIEPVVTHTFYDGKQRFVTYLLKDYNSTLASEHYLNRKSKNAITLSRLQNLSMEILDDWYEIAG